MSVLENAWAIPCRVRDYVGIICSKIKNTRKALKNQSRNTCYSVMAPEKTGGV
jgi:hypothetical protein